MVILCGAVARLHVYWSGDPELCGIESADYRLFDAWPCTEANSLCEWRIGVDVIGCDSPVEEMSWGMLKAMWR